ncbi:hypothetical protein [Deinococcus multiflagellatus]|uniref:Bacteriophage lambda Replication protein O N-terminal domain-containing protein n=1 Tax=Deinococcus multiflagellatus TaxID=1656887 RepID=A0ABW1ZRW9_9DEIO
MEPSEDTHIVSARKTVGFELPNYTQSPNVLFDDLLPVMSNAELRVTLVLIRLTFGWHRERSDKMSNKEIAKLAGISPNSAKTGISEGMRRGTIKRYKAKDELNREVFRYGLRLATGISTEEFVRERKTPVSLAPDDVQPGSRSQILATSKFARMTRPYSQILAICPVTSYGQILATSYKEQRNILVKRKKKRETLLASGLPDHRNTSLFPWRMSRAKTPLAWKANPGPHGPHSPVRRSGRWGHGKSSRGP